MPENFPVEQYTSAATRGEPVFRIDPDRSQVVIRVYRGGVLARFGHDHVVASHAIRGYVLLSIRNASADLYAPLGLLSVDEPALRAQAKLDTQPSETDIEGTRKNMRTKVLEVERYPFVSLHVDSVQTNPLPQRVDVTIDLHGQSRQLPIAVEFERSGDDKKIRARGQFSISQSDFGIVPFSVFGGALRVEDKVDITFDVYGTRMPHKPAS